MQKSDFEQARKVLSNLKDHSIFALFDLKVIEDKLNDQRYSKLSDFSKDLKDHVSEKYSESKDQFADAAQYALQIIQKELNRAYIYDANTWSKLIIKYNDRYKYIISKSSDTSYLTMKDLHDFVSATEYLKDEKYSQKMIKIIKSKEPKQNIEKSNITIDLVKLQKSTILALIDFAKESLAKKNIPYPS